MISCCSFACKKVICANDIIVRKHQNDLQNGISVNFKFRNVLCGICSGFEADFGDETPVH